jgi:hypothetical protein
MQVRLSGSAFAINPSTARLHPIRLFSILLPDAPHRRITGDNLP